MGKAKLCPRCNRTPHIIPACAFEESNRWAVRCLSCRSVAYGRFKWLAVRRWNKLREKQQATDATIDAFSQLADVAAKSAFSVQELTEAFAKLRRDGNA